MATDYRKDYGPSWNDVRIHLAEVAKANNVSTKIEIGQTSPATGSSQLYFRVVAIRRSVSGEVEDEVGEGHPWPAGDWQTVPAMLLALLAKLDWKLTVYSRRASAK